MTGVVDTTRARHYEWGEGCDGWLLRDGADLSVIQERVPPGGSEVRHFHRHARQFFYILSGRATLEVDGEVHELGAGQGCEVAPGQWHQLANDADRDLIFLVVSAPQSHGDRVVADGND
ncbi:MAG: cupin domain-containing protein [Gammaproteobacteria bacterium]|jgi:mannose-6-phosphate isomerase-like protein (cupin superfamily)